MLEKRVQPNWQGLRDSLTPGKKVDRVHFMELFLDIEVQRAVVKQFGLNPAIEDPDICKRGPAVIELQRFLGYDCVRCQPRNWDYPHKSTAAADTEAGAQGRGERGWVDEGLGIIQTRADFEKYPWPDPAKIDWSDLEWYERNLPDDMAVYTLTCHQLEELCWIMGYQGLCMAMYDQPDLVRAMVERIEKLETEFTRRLVQLDRVKFVWGSDDMGFKTGTMVQADFIRRNVLPCHKKCAQIAHDAGRSYLLHACGKLDEIMPDLIDEVKVDAKHSFEDVIRPMPQTKKLWGGRVGLIGGIDVDFLCRANEDAIRRRVRETLDACLPGGGYALGTGNSVANYIPLKNYLVMLDEGRKYKA
jgi:uroporphyrinogen decarboxylase